LPALSGLAAITPVVTRQTNSPLQLAAPGPRIIGCIGELAFSIEDLAMLIRSYQPGDEHAQARIYNEATASLPGFKPANAQEILRRYQAADFDPQTKFYAEQDGEVVGYAVFDCNGRVSCPWCLPSRETSQAALLEAVLAEMKSRGLPEAWAAYRADWQPMLQFLGDHNFRQKRSMVNYVAEVTHLLTNHALSGNDVIEPIDRADIPRLIALFPGMFGGSSPSALEHFFWDNTFYNFANGLWVLQDRERHAIRGIYSLVVDSSFADPIKIDPAMPCFRLGAFGTERQRHKRVNGLFSSVFADYRDADVMLSSALQSRRAGSELTHIAAQVPSDAGTLCGWFSQRFQHQGSFPILAKQLAAE
jgi:hypothetical protein